MLEALFTEYFKLPVSVIETQCYTMGDEKCVFEVEPLPVKNYWSSVNFMMVVVR